MVLSVSSASGWQEMAPLIAHVPGQKRLENQANRRLWTSRASQFGRCAAAVATVARTSSEGRKDGTGGGVSGLITEGRSPRQVPGCRCRVPGSKSRQIKGGARTWSAHDKRRANENARRIAG